MPILEKAHNIIAPDPETLWERGGATLQTVEIDPGRHETVPFFDLEISHKSSPQVKDMEDNLGRSIGRKITRTYVTSDGIDRATRLFLPEQRDNDFIVAMTTPWYTSIDGMNSENAETIAKELNVAVALIGAEHSATKYNPLLDGVRLVKTIKQSSTISLAKTAQSCQLITSDMCYEYDLPQVVVKVGESRAAMETDAEYAYAPLYDITIPYQDKTALCLPDRLFSADSETHRLLQAPGSELVGVAYLAAVVARKKAAKRYLGSLSLNPNFNISSLIGVGPALASGEAGRFIDWLPKDAAGHQVTFKSDVASRPNRQRQLYARHKNIAIITLTGSHATLAHIDTLRHLIERVGNFAHEYKLHSGDISSIDWRNVHLKDDDRYRSMV